MNLQHHLKLNRSSLHCLLFVGVAFAVAMAVIWLDHAVVTVLLSVSIALVVWRSLEKQRRLSNAKTEQIAQIEQQYQTEITTLQLELNELSNHRENSISEIAIHEQTIATLNERLNAIEITLETLESENSQLKSEKTQLEEAAHTFLEEAYLNSEKASQLSIERDYLLFKIKKLANKIQQRTAERNLDRCTIQDLSVTLNQLEQELTKHKKAALATQPTRDLTARPFNMDDMRFAKIATIKLDPLPNPETLKEETKRHYDQRNGGFDPSPITLNSISEYLRHRYSNYDDLCREFGSYNEKARNVLKCRVNTTIWTALSAIDIQLDD